MTIQMKTVKFAVTGIEQDTLKGTFSFEVPENEWEDCYEDEQQEWAHACLFESACKLELLSSKEGV